MGSFNQSFQVLSSGVMAAIDDVAHPIVIVTSSKAGEGKTLTCAKLAASLASRERRVVVVDCDLRQPGAHAVLGGHNSFGVTDVLLERRSIGDCLQYIAVPSGDGLPEHGLFLVAAGPPVAEPAELLSHDRTARLLDKLADQADVVLVDTAPVLPVADTLALAAMASAAILVVDTHTARAADIERARDLLSRHGGVLLGLVLNQVRRNDGSVAYGSDHGYGTQGQPDHVVR